ncbi:MAG: MBL fold metallo-hydrolase [Rhodospirillaceae bacterium]|nr:MBL fold metallo-hydrolase [Rhodospirillaceae bacterium]
MKVTILGCGGAGGVPSLSDGYGRCNPDNPKNNRRRSSILVSDGHTTVLVDAGPDVRAQLLDAKVRHLDAVLFTHLHADHTHGIDELREINRAMRKPLDAYADAETFAALESRFGYAFEGIEPGQPFFKPWLVAHDVGETMHDIFMLKTLQVRAFRQDHGFSTTLGLRFGDVVYSTDVLELPDAAKDVIRGCALWIVDAFTDTPHPTHAHLEKTLGWIDELKPKRAVITHMGPNLDYDAVNFKCPVGVTAAYDGMVIEVPSAPKEPAIVPLISGPPISEV